MDFSLSAEALLDDAAIKMSSSPSPTSSNPSAVLTPGAGAHPGINLATAPRRPPRKSTLTQQQKNQKRQRATQDQLVTLEIEFNKNPTPTAGVRERIAEDINMTERSVQIWFQNRRAKIKLLAKKSIETGEGCDIPESMRQYLAIQEMESGKSMGGTFFGRSPMPYGNHNMFMGAADQNAQSKVVINHLECSALRIGSWSRMRQAAMDLIAFYSPDKATVTYYIHSENAGYKIEYPFACIKNIYLDHGDAERGKPGGITIELTRPPHFFMDSSGTGGFVQVGDFTENQQATRCYTHCLGGNPKVLSAQLAKLISLDSFANRHNPAMHTAAVAAAASAAAAAMTYERPPMAVSAPVSPTGVRPASQPSYSAAPPLSMFPPPPPQPENPWATSMHPPPPRVGGGMGHKRQRSRSVPEPVNFSMLHAPTPSFFVQHPMDPSPASARDLGIYAPVPHNPNALGNNLRIDTSTPYNIDFRHAMPLSAGTTSSDFASPAFFPQESPLNESTVAGGGGGGAAPNPPPAAPAPAAMPHPSSYSPYSMPFLPPSASPLSFMSGDPAIVEQSPPHLPMTHRSASADVYRMSHDMSNLSDDGTGLNEMYSKHTLTLPMHTPSPAFMEQSVVDLDMNNLVSFDHGSLSPPETTGQ